MNIISLYDIRLYIKILWVQNVIVFTFQEDLGVYCVPLPDFLALNFPSPTRVQQNSILVHPTQSNVDSSSITAPNQQNQQPITVQRIGRDARPLMASEIARYQHMFASNQNQRSSAEQQPQQRRPEAQNSVSSQERPENSRLRNLAQRIPRLNPVTATTTNSQSSSSSSSSAGSSDQVRIIPWSERSRLQVDRSLDNEFVLRLPFVDLGIQPTTHIVTPSGRRISIDPARPSSRPDHTENDNWDQPRRERRVIRTLSRLESDYLRSYFLLDPRDDNV